jgi:enoyl-CoA hydratase
MVEYETRGRVAILTINRPEARNAVNGAVANGMETGIDRLEADDDVWAGVVAATGTVFSAGADLKLIAAGGFEEMETERGGFAGLVRRERRKPLVAAVDGPALAGGCEIALACDLIVASTQASFGLPEVKRSLVAAAGGLFRLPRALPRNLALEIALTGDAIDAERAHAHGLVNHLSAPGHALDDALALAERICANAPVAVWQTRRIVLEAAYEPDARGWEITRSALADVVRTEDFREGPLAFVEKRPPNWKGR